MTTKAAWWQTTKTARQGFWLGGGMTGATVKDLMRRLGHASPAASYRYLHAVDGRDAEIASALSELAAHGDAAKLPRSIVARH